MKTLKKFVWRTYVWGYNFWFFQKETYSGTAGTVKIWRRRYYGTISDVEIMVAGDLEIFKLFDIPEHTLRWFTICELPDDLREKAKMALNWHGGDDGDG